MQSKERVISHNQNPFRVCECCGRLLEKNRRRYCSKDCKEGFVFKLKWFNNLLRVLNTKYATFTFTDTFLILHVLPMNSSEVYSYFYDRLPGRKPAQDMGKMVFELGEIWWFHKERSKSEKYASDHILDCGHKKVHSMELLQPRQIKYLGNVGKQMTFLKISREEIFNESRDSIQEKLKSAYKRQALRHHPDMGGNAEMFRKINQAYLDLKEWLKTPSFNLKKGVPGYWCYIAGKTNWIAPLEKG